MSGESGSVGTSEHEQARNRAFGVGVVRDPYPVYHEMQAECPVHEGSLARWFPDSSDARSLVPDGTSIATTCTHEAAAAIFRDASTFSSEHFYAFLNTSIGQSIIGMDEPDHRRMRVLVQGAFSRPQMDRWRHDFIEPIVDEHFDLVVPSGACDLQAEVGSTVPVHTIAAALGLPASERATFFDLGVQMTNPLVTQQERESAAAALGDYVVPLAAERRRRSAGDLIGILVDARMSQEESNAALDSRPLSDDEIATFVRVLVVAGSSTTYRAYGTLIYHLLQNPDQLALVRADRGLWANAIEEALRIDQPLATLGRIASADTMVEGVKVAAGTRVDISIGAANHDPTVFEDPERFDVHRERLDRHLSFGFGIHRCLGIHLARTELEVMLERTLERLPNLRLDPGADDVYISGIGLRMVSSLPVVYDPS